MDNFIVSARKYRPATFVSVVGQSHITSTLKNAILRGQLAHAYLFCGPRGVGKTTCARIFAKAINCLDPKDGQACNECESCKAFNQTRSFNIHELDAASNNSVDDIRSLTEQVRIPPQIGRYSVYIIDEVHMLSLQAFNAFLKTLEEPPAHAVFILATTEKHKIIPTILSRCQIYDFNRIRVEDSVSYLKYIAEQEGVKFDDESLHIIARKADGGMRDALSMFDKVVSFCGEGLTARQVAETLNVLDYDTYFSITDQILAGDYTAALLTFDEVLRKGFSAQTFTAGLNSHFRDLLMCKNPQTLPLLEVTGSVAEKYKAQAARCEVPMLVEGINLLTQIDSGLRIATNQRLNVELGLMKLCGLGQKKNNDALAPSLPPLAGRAAADRPKATSVTPSPDQATATVASAPVPPVPVPIEPVSVPNPVAKEATAATGEAAPQSQPEQVSVKTPDESIEAQAPGSVSGSVLGSPVPSASSVGGMSLSGRSISSILNGEAPAAQDETVSDEDVPLQEEAVDIDEQAEMRLIKGCELYAKELMASRPRMGVIMSEAKVNDNIVTLKVPNESSYDEIMNGLADIQRAISRLGGVRVPVEFNVIIEADKKGLKPIKVEDRLKHLTERNPLINELRSALELDVE